MLLQQKGIGGYAKKWFILVLVYLICAQIYSFSYFDKIISYLVGRLFEKKATVAQKITNDCYLLQIDVRLIHLIYRKIRRLFDAQQKRFWGMTNRRSANPFRFRSIQHKISNRS